MKRIVPRASTPHSLTGLSRLEDCENRNCPAGKYSTLTGLSRLEDCENRNCPAGKYSTLTGLSRLEDCEKQDCLGENYYCPGGSVQPKEVRVGYYSTPENVSRYRRTGQKPCNEAISEFCGGGVRSTVPPGYFIDDNDRRYSCPAGFYCTRGQKHECNTTGAYCSFQSYEEMLCDAGSYCPNSTTRILCEADGPHCPQGSIEPSSCPPGKTGKNALGFSACLNCLPGHFRGLSTSELLGCLSCAPGLFTSGSGHTTCILPDKGSFQDKRGQAFAKKCTTCLPGKRVSVACTPTSDTECTACDGGRVSVGGDRTACEECGAGKYTNKARAACDECGAGKYGVKAGATNHSVCQNCATGTFSSVSGVDEAAKCNACPPGKYGNISGASSSEDCKACAEGRFAGNSGQTACEACIEGISARGSSYCVECKSGKVIDTSFMPPRCTLCEQDKISAGGDAHCTVCTAGTFADPKRVKCTPCPVGTWSNAIGAANDTLCRPCPRGTFSSAAGLDAAAKCNACSPGKYGNISGASSSEDCKACAEGRFAANSGQTACEACIEGISARGSSYCVECKSGKVIDTSFMPPRCTLCARGKISVGGDAHCTVCTAGTFADPKRVKCTPCPVGTWSNAIGAANDTLCRPCPRGTFSSASGLDAADKCSACPPGKHSITLGANRSETCLMCEEGYFAKESGQTACKACIAGSSKRGSSYCSDCPAGTEYNSTTKTCGNCPHGSYSSVGGRCSACLPGTYEQDRVNCVLCPAGTWSNAIGAANDTLCRPCPSGTFSSALGVDNITKCESCERGRFAESPGSDACKRCPDRMTSNEDRTGCVVNSCTPGSMLEKSAEGPFCKPCSKGTFSATGRGCTVCEEGRFTKTNGSDACERCPDFMTSRSHNATVCIADRGYIVGEVLGSTKTLHPCPEAGARCKNQTGARVEVLELEPDFWRPTHSSLDIRPCKVDSGCVGGASTGSEGQGVCDNATKGPYCAVCAKEYKRQGGACVLCDELGGSATTPLLVMIGVGALVTLLALAAYKYRPSMFGDAGDVALVGMADHSGDHDGHGRVVEKFKIAYGFAQVVSSTFEEFDLKFPPAFSALASAFSVVNLNIFGFLSMGCVVDVDFYGELTTTCTAPVVLAVLSLGYARRRVKSKKEKRTALQIFTRISLVLLFCVYSGVTRNIFTTFKCERFATAGLDEAGCQDKGYTWHDGACYRSYLRADLSLSCDASEYSDWKAFAVVMALIYPFGVPVLFAWLLHRNKDDASLSFIRAAYEDRFYWWEVVELGRKLLLTLVIVFFYEGSASQILVTLLVTFGFTLVLMRYTPYKSDDDDFLAAFSQALLVLTSLASLCLKVHITDSEEWSVGAFDFFLTGLVVSVPVFALFEALVAAGLLRRARCRRGKPKSVAPVDAEPHDDSTDPMPVLLVSDEPRGATTVEALHTMIRDISDEDLLERIKLAVISLQKVCDDVPAAEPTPSADTMYASLGTRFNEHIKHDAAQETSDRRVSALAKAHLIYDEAEATRRARIANQRREQRAKLQHRLEARKKQRAEEQRARAFV